MFFIDSWVWLEFFTDGKEAEKSENVLQKLEQQQGIINTLVLTEVRYRIASQFSKEKADRLLVDIKSFNNLTILPVTEDVAELAADIRLKHYNKDNQMSYADAIHTATAILAGCDTLYTGDPDFEPVERITTETI